MSIYFNDISYCLSYLTIITIIVSLNSLYCSIHLVIISIDDDMLMFFLIYCLCLIAMSGINLLSLGNQTSIISTPSQYQYNTVINLVLRPLSDVVDYEWSVITLEYLLILIYLFYIPFLKFIKQALL